MKKIIKEILLIMIGLMLIMAGNWYYQHKKAVNICKNECYYQNYEKEGNVIGRISIRTGIGWYNQNRAFETQEQCIEYCLTVK